MGARHLDFGMLSAKEGIVSDGEGPPNRITVAAPSQNVVTANITGRAAYAGLEPEKGVSAMLIAAHILMRLPLGRIDEETTANIGHMKAGLKRNIAPEDALLGRRVSEPQQREVSLSRAQVPWRLRQSAIPVPRGVNFAGYREYLPGLPDQPDRSRGGHHRQGAPQHWS